ncbi:MAG: hypothetical protein K2X86_00865 [Cytophagaceae bacterium]|nr:hypothetical protein [Cytophagaceae bacterium]
MRPFKNHFNRLFLILLVSGLIFSYCKKKDKVEPPADQEDTTMVYFQADNSNIQYSGRIDFSNPKKPAFSFPGVSIKAKFQGTAIDVLIKDYGMGTVTSTNYYNILIDGSLYTVLKVRSADTLYPVVRNLADGEHTIEVFKRTESSVGKSSFLGFQLRVNKTLLALPAKPARKIEFIGDSFTCGYGNEVSTNSPNTGFHSDKENNYTAWGALTCRALNAEYHCTAYSGRGMYRNNSGSTSGTLPLIYLNTIADAASPAWSPSTYIPDVAVIHLGTNDFFPEQWTPPSMVDSTQFVNTYKNFVGALRGYYPNAHIICVVPNSVSDWYPANFRTLSRMKNYVDAVVDHHVGLGDTKVYYFEIPTQSAPYGEDWHPTNATHVQMSNLIVPFIQTKTGW